MRRFFKKRSNQILNVFVLLPFLAQTFVTPLFALDELIPETQVDIPIDTSEDILDEGISDPIWIVEGDMASTNSVVVLGNVYTAPQNESVSLTFTKLPEEKGYLTINEITLTEEEVDATNAVSNIAYDISTDMVDGTYEYDLTLPTTEEDISVVYAESREEILSNTTEVNEDLMVEDGKVEIKGLDHFTVFVVVNPNLAGNGNTCTVASIDGICYDTIQGAINAAQTNGSSELDTINVKNGTYSECLNVTGDNISIIGESRNGVVIDNSSCLGYGININGADNISFKKLTVQGATSASTGYTFKITNSTNVDLRKITVQDSRKTAIDIHGVKGVYLNNIKVMDTIGGFGLMLIDSNDIEVGNIVTENNAWGGVSIQTSGAYYPGGVDNVLFSGSFEATETAPLLLEKDPPTYYDVTNVTVPSQFDYIVYTFREGDNYMQWFYQETIDSAITLAENLISSSFPIYSDILVYDISEGNYWVLPGMSIQDAIDEATDGDIVNIKNGTYEEQLAIDGKNLILNGEDIASTIINSPTTLTTQYTTSSQNKPVIYVHNSNSTIQDLTVDGLGRGNGNYRMQGVAFYNASGEVNNVEIKNIKETPANGSQHGVALYVYNDDGINRTFTADSLNLNNYQKNGTAFAGDGLTANITNSTVKGLGQIDFIAQNGIQYGYGATGKAENNIVTDNYYTPTAWAASGILLYDAGENIQLINNNIYNNGGVGLYVSGASANLEIFNNHIYDNWGDGIDLIGSGLENARIYNNIVENNDYGMWIDSDVPNTLQFFNNTFSNTVNAEDVGNHYLDNGSVGNFWSDYIGLDLDGDGIGETEYSVDTDSSDRYPLTSNYLSVDVISVETSKEYYKDGDTLSITVEVTNNGAMELDPAKETLVVNLKNPNGSFIGGSFREVYPLSLAPGETKTITFYTTSQSVPSSWSEGTYKVYTSVYSNRTSLGYLMGGQSSNTTFTVDNTPPSKPIGLHRRNIQGDLFACGDTAQRQTMIPDWDDITDDPSFSHFEYSSFNPNGSQGLNEKVLYVSELYNTWLAPNDGTYGYAVRSVDKAGNRSEWSLTGESLAGSCQITYDSVAPVVTLTSPIDNYYTNQTSVLQTWDTDATDVDYYEYRSCWNDPTSEVCNEIYSTIRTTKSRTVNNNNISFWWQVRGTDEVGNTGDWSTARKITIDTITPVVDIISHNDNDLVRGTQHISGAVTDLNLSHYWFVITNSAGTNVAGPGKITTSDNPAIISLDWNTEVVNDGLYTIKLEARDLANNKGINSIKWVNIIVDNTKPVISTHSDMILIEGEAFPTDTLALTDENPSKVCVNATDLTGTLGSSGYTCVDVDSSNLTGNQFAFANEIKNAIEDWKGTFDYIDLDVLPEGQYQIDYYATDLAGNESTTQTFVVTIQNNIPTVEITPSTSEVSQGTPAVVLSANVTNGNAPYTYLWSNDCTGTNSTATVSTATLGTFTCDVQVTDADGDIATSQATVTVGAVGGLTDENTTTTNTATNTLLTYGSGTGNGGEEESNEEEQSTEDKEVLGETTCEAIYKISGTVFYDKNDDGIKDENEKGVDAVDVEIYDSEGNLVKTVTTDEEGYWEAYLCPGEYTTQVEGAEDQSFVLGESDITLDISVEKKTKWWLIVLIVSTVLILLGVLVDRYKKRKGNILQ